MKARLLATLLTVAGIALPMRHQIPLTHADLMIVPTVPTMEGIGSLTHGGVSAPVIPPATQAQLIDHAKRIDAYRLAVAQHAASTNTILPDGDPGYWGGLAGNVSVAFYTEPNTYAYRNYCGPAASQVLISNWTGNVPTIDSMGAQEQIDPNRGTQATNMVGPINSDTNSVFYMLSAADSQGTFSDYVGGDIYGNHHPLITSLLTEGNGYTLNGWSVDVTHIVSIIGFNFVTPGAGTISYMDTSGTVAGTTATGYNTYGADPFWSLVTLNNNQIW